MPSSWRLVFGKVCPTPATNARVPILKTSSPALSPGWRRCCSPARDRDGARRRHRVVERQSSGAPGPGCPKIPPRRGLSSRPWNGRHQAGARSRATSPPAGTVNSLLVEVEFFDDRRRRPAVTVGLVVLAASIELEEQPAKAGRPRQREACPTIRLRFAASRSRLVATARHRFRRPAHGWAFSQTHDRLCAPSWPPELLDCPGAGVL